MYKEIYLKQSDKEKLKVQEQIHGDRTFYYLVKVTFYNIREWMDTSQRVKQLHMNIYLEKFKF